MARVSEQRHSNVFHSRAGRSSLNLLIIWSLLLRSRPSARTIRLYSVLCLLDTFRQSPRTCLAVPFLKRLIGDRSFDEKLCELSSLRLAFEWHDLSATFFAFLHLSA